MNQDILFVLATFCDSPTLCALSRVSQGAYSVAARRLYRTVRVRSMDELVAIHGALARNVWLLPLVFGLLFDDAVRASARSVPPGLDARRMRAFINGIVPRLTNLKAFALDCETLPAQLRSLLTARLAALPQLRGVKLLGIGRHNLQAFRASQTPLEHISMREYGSPALIEWLSEHSATLRTLHVDKYDPLVRRLAANPDAPAFPHLHRLVLSDGRITLSSKCVRLFYAVRSLSIQRPVGEAEAAWSSLEHLDAFLPDTPIEPHRGRPYGPAVRSLQLTHAGYASLDWEKIWASPQVSALALVVSINEFAAHAAALGAFSGLRMLDVTLSADRFNRDAGSWLASAALSLSVPSHVEVLTLRGAAGIYGRPPNALETLRRSVPALKLLRIILRHPLERVAFAPSGPVEWITACQIVADYLPHWRETRAPWDDIRDI